MNDGVRMTEGEYRDIELRTLPDPRWKFAWLLENNSRQTWTPANFSLGWQFFDPETNFFILEGAWAPVPRDVPPGQTVAFEISIPFPPEAGGYQIYVSPIQQPEGWAYRRGRPFLRIVAQASDGEVVRVVDREIATAARQNALPPDAERTAEILRCSGAIHRSENHRLIRIHGAGAISWRVIAAHLAMCFGPS